jgi:parallel beta-helix repeat protein
MIQGTGMGVGLVLTMGRSNVTIKNVAVRGFSVGIKLFEASDNIIRGNNITANSGYGIHLESSSNNTISGNNITDNDHGIYLEDSSNSILRSNILEENRLGFHGWGAEVSHYLHSIDTSNLVDGKPVYYLINQHNLSINPSTYPAVGFLALINSTNITVEGLTLTGNSPGLLIAYTTSTTIQDNTITNNMDGISMHVSSDNTISGNNITANNENGISLYKSSTNIMRGNNITNNENGVYLSESPTNTVAGNSITNNDRGVWLSYSSNDTISGNKIANNTYFGINFDSSSTNIIRGNNITNNHIGINLYDSHYIILYENIVASSSFGITFEGSSNNSIYHNNFIGNYKQVEDPGINITWDAGYPSGGNYWSEYNGTDLFHGPTQTLMGSDGVGDSSFVINLINNDSYPLMGPITVFDAGTWNDVTYLVQTVSNSTLSNFNFSTTHKMINFDVTGPNGTIGFSRVGIPKELLYSPNPMNWVVRVNGTLEPFRVLEDAGGNYTYIYFTYIHGAQKVEITGTDVIPEFPAWTSMLLTLIVLTVVIYKRRLTHSVSHAC